MLICVLNFSGFGHQASTPMAPKSNLVKSECHRSRLVARISRNLNRSARDKTSVEVFTVLTSAKLTKVPLYNFRTSRHELPVADWFYVPKMLRPPCQNYRGSLGVLGRTLRIGYNRTYETEITRAYQNGYSQHCQTMEYGISENQDDGCCHFAPNGPH